MLADFAYLWKYREQPSRISRWLIVWTKRSLQAIPLMRILFRAAFLRLQGAQIGRLVILGRAKIEGRLSNLQIGDQVSLGRCEIALHDKVLIGRCVAINDGVVILTASHGISDAHWKTKKNPITIGDFAWIATNALILPGVSIGRGSVIGAGAVVRENVPDYAVVIGNPSVVLGIERAKMLNYSPVLFNAPFEAWIGHNINIVSNEIG